METSDTNVVPLERHPTADELIARARGLQPVLRERAQACEDARRVSDETIDEFERAGLLRMCQPARYGGYDLGWDALCDVSEVLASACGSQAWLQHIFADHKVLVATFPAQVQEEVWGKNHNAIASASFDPVGRAKRVEGGFLFSGRHGFSSGIDFADWVICGGMIVESEGLDGPHFFLVPKSEVEVLDDWYTMALEGTGSKSFVLRDRFIPAYRFLDGRQSLAGTGPGTAVNKAPVYRLPRFGGVTSTGFASLAVGMARGVLEEWLAYTGTRSSRGVAIGAQQGTQIIAARAAAEIDAAHALYQTTLRGGMRKVEEGGTISSAERLMAKRNVAFACQLALKAGTRLFKAAGGRALYTRGAMQRQYRNLLGAVAHHGVNWESSAVEYGRALLEQYGAPRQNPPDRG
jgi:3-hydroxy-9,10-secoandrosta-1,3,5(10)-triene-9,17-dione monooxygenase